MDWLRTKMVIVLLGVQYLSQDFWLLRQTPHLFWLGVQGKFLFPIIPETRFIQHGDILIGVLEAMTHRKSSVSRNETYCSDRTFLKGYGEAVAYAVEKVNKQQLLPHNLTLGYAILNSCDSRTVTAAQSVSFLPYTKCSSEENKTTYDVVAVLGATTSGQTIAATHILERGQVPMISVFATSDELVSIERFPYFLRVVPPDKYQFKAITKLIKTFAWTYVSVIYADSSYGLNAFQLLRNYFEENEICLAVARMLPKRSDEEAISIAKALVKQHARSPVAVMIMSVILLQKVVTLTQRFLPNKTFVWIGTDAWSRYATSLGDDNNLLLDSLLVDIPNADISSFNDWFIKRRPGKMSDPWFQTLWENQFNCSLDHGTCNVNETEVKKLLSTLETRVPHIIDAISMIANATSRVLRSWDCRSITRSTARKCVTGPRLLRELHATKQSGYTGEMELDSNGDRFGRYEVNQLRAISSSRYEIVTVYTYESASDKLMSVSKVSWTDKILLPGFQHPVSCCSSPCGPTGVRVLGRVRCCWTCIQCGVSRYLNDAGTACMVCPNFTWPDPKTNFTTCYHIKPEILSYKSEKGAYLMFIAFLGLALNYVVSLFVYIHRCSSVITASCPKLSFFMLLAMITGYLTVIPLLMTPTDKSCKFVYVFFCTSISSICGSLFVRALYIYYGNLVEPHKRMEIRYQLIFATVILSIQVAICLALMPLHLDWHTMYQPNSELPHVVSSCVLPRAGLLSFLFYNLIFLVLSALLTSRTHVENRERNLILTCSTITLIMWVCFSPAYTVAESHIIRMLILALFLFISHFVAIGSFFLPTVYVVWQEQRKVDAVKEELTMLKSQE